ncbi:MAG: hypothetical protein U5N26_10520 [Candidatus Marinimicrobia bacterium]|nr:hypothetical protein [Candidatus Neomarinimicrobiota bacterium]
MKSASGRPFILEDARSGRVIVNGAGFWRWQLSGYGKAWNGIYRHLLEGMIEESLRREGRGFIRFARKDLTAMQYVPFDISVQVRNPDLLDASASRINVALYDSLFSVIRRRDHDFGEGIMDDPAPFRQGQILSCCGPSFRRGIYGKRYEHNTCEGK